MRHPLAGQNCNETLLHAGIDKLSNAGGCADFERSIGIKYFCQPMSGTE
jgi:hypothetical protein